LAYLALGLLAVPTACSDARAAAWQLTGPARPAAGEAATYTLRGAPGEDYGVAVFAGVRACPRTQLPGDPAQTFETGSFLDGNGADVRQLSFARGRSTICAYDHTATVVAGKAIRTKQGRDRLRITAVRWRSSLGEDALVTASGYLGRAAESPFAAAADQHDGTVLVTALPPGESCRERPPTPDAPHTFSEDIAAARFSTQVAIVNAFRGVAQPAAVRVPDRASPRPRGRADSRRRPCTDPARRHTEPRRKHRRR
jgi:hypothetical protein